MFKILDVDESNSITFNEIQLLFEVLRTHYGEGQLQMAFESLDINKDGHFEFEEFIPFGKLALHHGATVDIIKQLRKEQNKRDIIERFPQSDLEKLRTIFELMDVDQSHAIDLDEFHSALKHMGHPLPFQDVYTLFKKVDKDGDGNIEYEEFVIGVGPVFLQTQSNPSKRESLPQEFIEELKTSFSIVDRDGSGSLSKKEMEIVLKELGNRIPTQELEKIFSFFDKDGDDCVTFEEFIEGIAQLGANIFKVPPKVFDKEIVDTEKLLEISKQEIFSLTVRNDALITRCSIFENENSNLTEKNDLLNEEVEKLRKEVLKLRKVARDVTELKNENAELKVSIRNLTQEVDDARNARVEEKKRNLQLKETIKEIEFEKSLNIPTSPPSSPVNATITKRNSLVLKELEFTNIIEDLEKKNLEMEQMIVSLESQLKATNIEREMLQLEVSKLKEAEKIQVEKDTEIQSMSLLDELNAVEAVQTSTVIDDLKLKIEQHQSKYGKLEQEHQDCVKRFMELEVKLKSVSDELKLEKLKVEEQSQLLSNLKLELSSLQQRKNSSISPSANDQQLKPFLALLANMNHVLEKTGSDFEKYLPLTPVLEDLKFKLKDGVVLCKYLCILAPDMLDERVINLLPVSDQLVSENHNLLFNSVIAIGVPLNNVSSQDLNNGHVTKIFSLFIDIIIKISIQNAQKTATKEERKLLPEHMMLTRVNALLKVKQKPILERFADLENEEKFNDVMSCLLDTDHVLSREGILKEFESKLKKPTILTLEDFELKDEKKIQFLVAELLNLQKPSVVHVPEKLQDLHHEQNLSKLEDLTEIPILTVEDREERVYCSWMTSLGVTVNNIAEDCHDGIKLLKIMDLISPGHVIWKKVSLNPKNDYVKTENANYVVHLAKELGFSVVGIAGKDLIDKNRKLILAIVWQMMKFHVFSILQQIGGKKELKKEDILDWANTLLSGKFKSIEKFDDVALSSGRYLLTLIDSVYPGSVEQKYVKEGVTLHEKQLNAQYAINLARRKGCTVFLLWEDIVELKSNMIMVFVAVLMASQKK